MDSGKPGIVNMTAEDWEVRWTIEGWTALEAAKTIAAGTGETNLFQSVKTMRKINGQTREKKDEDLLDGNVITQLLKAYGGRR
jgi:hypothetical protein